MKDDEGGGKGGEGFRRRDGHLSLKREFLKFLPGS